MTEAVEAVSAGRFIVVEGIDGSGSTTQAKRLVAELTAQGRTAEFTCEPTSGPIGALLRQILAKRVVVATSAGGRAPDWRTMALLFAADRADHNDVEITPKLLGGIDLVSDRYVLSSLAYQSLTSPGGRASLPWLRQINAHARVPDLTIVLNVSAEVARLRRGVRGGPAELYEFDSLQQRLADFYAEATAFLEGPVVVIDAESDIEVVARLIRDAVSAL